MKKLVSLGEILMRLSCEDHLKFSQAGNFKVVYGGSEANVAISAAHYGKPVEIVTVVPQNDLGKASLAALKVHNVGVENVRSEGEKLGLYFLEAGAVNRGSKVIYDRGNSAFALLKSEWFNWEEILMDSDWFHWSGITPAISENAAKVCLDALTAASEKGITISADLNYRANLWKYEADPGKTMTDLVSKSTVLLAGSYACSKFFGINSDDHSELAKKLKARFPKLQYIAITGRKEISSSHHKWSASLYNGKEFYQSTEYDILPVIDRVGTGDSFMGALIYGLQNFDDQKALDFATAASCLKHTVTGDFNLVTKEEVLNLMQGDRTGRISR